MTCWLTQSAFGRVLSIDGGDPSLDEHLFGFTGRETDADTHITDGWMYYRARYYNPSTGRFVSQDPIGFLAGDANLYRYVGNGATWATDPSGLEAVGHHLVPEALWAAFGFDMTVADDVFNRKDARIETDVMYEPDNTHNHTAHGKRVGYTAYVTDEMNTELCKFMTPTESKKGMSIARQREFAEHFLDHIKKMPTTTFIGAFNEEVATRGRVGQRAMKLRHSRGHFPKATGSDPVINVATGATVHLPPRRLSIGGRIVTAAPIVGFTLLFTQLRAQGKSVVEAGSRAVLDEGTMGCTEIAVDVGQAIGNEYFSVADHALQTNKNLHKKQAAITSGGEISATMGGRTLENWDPVPQKMPWWLGIFYW